LSVAWAVSGRSQKPGLPVSFSSSSWRALRRATSKTPPELIGAGFEVGYLIAHFAEFHEFVVLRAGTLGPLHRSLCQIWAPSLMTSERSARLWRGVSRFRCDRPFRQSATMSSVFRGRARSRAAPRRTSARNKSPRTDRRPWCRQCAADASLRPRSRCRA
jgi:hypothetical protein